jgi:hypothetical protein
VEKADLVYIPLIVGEASGVFAGFCPSWFTVSSPFFHDQEAKEGNVRRIRWGEVAATTIVMTTGVAISYHTKSGLPFWISLLTSAVFVAGYEYMIAHPAKEDGGPGLPANMNGALQWRSAR